MPKTIAKCINVTSGNKYLPRPLKMKKVYTVVETGLHGGQFIKINNGDEQHVFHQSYFKIVTV